MTLVIHIPKYKSYGLLLHEKIDNFKRSFSRQKATHTELRDLEDSVDSNLTNHGMIDLLHHAYNRYIDAYPHLTEQQAWKQWITK